MPGESLEYSEPGDDFQVADLVAFSVSAVGAAAADIQYRGVGGPLVCVCPDNYTLLAQQVSLVNVSAGAILATIQIVSGATTVVLLEVELGANSSTFISASSVRLIAPPTFKFQALSSAGASLDVQMLVRMIFGAGL
jgi:hypothetical protein